MARTPYLQVYFADDAEREAVKKAAEEDGRSVSNYCRRVVLEKAGYKKASESQE